MRGRRKFRAELEALQQELDVLRAENARLRLERQTPPSLGTVSARTRALADAMGDLDESQDSATTVLANASMIRASVLAVCEELQTTFAQLQRRLQSGVPQAEQDRRVADRRAVGARPAGEVPTSTVPAAAPPMLVWRSDLEERSPGELAGVANGNGDDRGHASNGHGSNGHASNGHGSNGHGRLAEGA